MSRNQSLAMLLVLLCGLCAIPAQAQVQRAFVSSTGNNANVATFCAVTAPCKTFAGALPAVAPNGEIVALDTAPYGSVTITQSISITAAPGVYAGISVFAGAGVTIAVPNISVVLRGITINGQGGANGISMTGASKLSVENCVIANFSGAAITVAGAGQLRVVNSLIRDSATGVQLSGGAIADISGSKILGSSADGILATANAAPPTTVAISDTVISGTGTGNGIHALSTVASTSTNVSVIRSTVTNTSVGVFSDSSAGTSVLTVSESMITGNATGLKQGGAGVATLESPGNNTVQQNTTQKTGTVTPVSPL